MVTKKNKCARVWAVCVCVEKYVMECEAEAMLKSGCGNDMWAGAVKPERPV